MTTGYIRQSSADIMPGLSINAGDLNAEYNQLQAAFDNVNGHDHSGSVSGTGQKLGLTTSVAGILPVSNGGTGDNALTANAVLTGNGTSPILASSTWSIVANVLTGGSASGVNSTWSGTLGVTGISTLGTVNCGALTTSGLITGPNASLTIATIGGVTFSGSGNITTNNGSYAGGTGNVTAQTFTAAGASAQVQFNDRGGGSNFLWYTTSSIARLWSGADKFYVDTSGNATAVNNFTAGGSVTLGGLVWQNNSGYMYTPSSLLTGGDVNASGVLRCGGTGGVYWQYNAGQMYTPYQLLTNSNMVANGNVYVGGTNIYWQSIVSYMYTNQNLQSAGQIVAASNLICGGTGGPLWQNNAGYMYTPSSMLSNGDVVAQGVLRCGGTGGNYWQDNGGYMYTNATILAQTGIIPNQDDGFGCGLTGNAWSQISYYFNNQQSDGNLKDDIRELPESIDILRNLTPKRYTWKHRKDSIDHWGFIAQEVEKVMQDLNHDFGGIMKENGGYGLSFNELMAALWQACKEMDQRIIELEGKK